MDSDLFGKGFEEDVLYLLITVSQGLSPKIRNFAFIWVGLGLGIALCLKAGQENMTLEQIQTSLFSLVLLSIR